MTALPVLTTWLNSEVLVFYGHALCTQITNRDFYDCLNILDKRKKLDILESVESPLTRKDRGISGVLSSE